MNRQGNCPLLIFRADEFESMSKCLADECAWWNHDDSDCILFSINKSIKRITYDDKYDLDDVTKGICHELTNVVNAIDEIKGTLIKK